MKSKKSVNLMWAPWRKTYLRSNPSKKTACVFCRLIRGKKDKKNLILLRTPHHVVILNRYPYNNGHLLIMPQRHIRSLSELNPKEKAEFFDVLKQAQIALEKAMKPQGFNVGMNLSDVAGAGVPNHLHWHLVPRWRGDVNFMPVLAGTRVISESLESAYEALARTLYGEKKKKHSLLRTVRRKK